MTRLAVKRPVTTVMVILIFLAVGLMSLSNLQMALMPEMDLPYAAVITTYTGAGPDQVQTLVSEPIEGAMARLNGLETVISQSSEGMSLVLMEFALGTDIDMAAIDIREAIDLVKYSLPEDVGDPIVMKMDTNSSATLYIAISSQTDDLVSLKNTVDNEIVDRLTRQTGVASVDVSGGREKEIRINLMEDRIRGYGITEATITGLLRSENISQPMGTVDEAGKNLSIKVDGEFTDLEEIRNLPVTMSSGGIVFIRDIAEVVEVYKDVESYSYLNGTPAVTLSISKQSNANDVNVSAAVLGEMDKITAEYPELEIKIIFDQADYITDAINSVVNSAVSGVILAVIVLFVFLQNVKATLVVGSAIPVSIVVTFAFMYFYGMTLNMMSLGGLVLGVGMLVDNSIVVLESVFRRMEEGEGKIQAAINGAKEVSMSIVASTLTTVAVFLPVAWMSGMISQIFNDLALSISFALAASLLVALTFVPLACSLFLTPSDEIKSSFVLARAAKKVLNAIDRAIDTLTNGYRKALIWSTLHRKITVLLAVVLFAGSMASLLGVGMELIPASDQSQVTVNVTLPSGAVLERTKDITDQVLERLDGIAEIKDVSTSVGSGGGFMGGGTNTASVTIALIPMGERSLDSTGVADLIRSRMQGVAGAEILVEASTSMMGSTGSTGDISYNIKGDSIDELMVVADDLVAVMSGVEGLRDVTSSVADTTPQATVKVDRLKASSVGLTVSSVISTVSSTVSGATATTFKITGDELDVKVGQDSSKIQSLEDLETLLIPTAYGISVPLREIASITLTESPLSISREDQQTIVSVYGYLDQGMDLGAVSRATESAISAQYIFPQGVSMETSGTAQSMNEEIYNLAIAFLMGIFVVYAIMAAEFESLYYPMIIMLAVPIAISTGFLGLFMMGQSLGITSALGLIMLLGIVVNNGIVLIDYINLLRGKGLGLMEAVQEAGPVRLRAILMTTLTTCLGLLPMMLGVQEGSEMMQPLATVVTCGLAMSTLITLFLVPVIYLIFENIRNKFSRGKKKKFRQIEEI